MGLRLQERTLLDTSLICLKGHLSGSEEGCKIGCCKVNVAEKKRKRENKHGFKSVCSPGKGTRGMLIINSVKVTIVHLMLFTLSCSSR